MAKEIIMPDASRSQGTITKLLKKVGDPVKRDEPIFESQRTGGRRIQAPEAGTDRDPGTTGRQSP